MQTPKVIFLDAVGTLFGVKGSVGQVYAQIAGLYGVAADPEALNAAFFQHFKSAKTMAFPEADPTHIPGREYAWWYGIAEQTFQTVEQLDQFADFDAFFAELYAYFAGANPWFVYPDAYQSLERWRRMDIELGIVSNFDSRLHTVLEALDLGQFFSSVTISTEVGAAKPDALIFATALQKHSCRPSAAWHVGDSFEEDYQGACTAGLRGIWLRRPPEPLSKSSE